MLYPWVLVIAKFRPCILLYLFLVIVSQLLDGPPQESVPFVAESSWEWYNLDDVNWQNITSSRFDYWISTEPGSISPRTPAFPSFPQGSTPTKPWNYDFAVDFDVREQRSIDFKPRHVFSTSVDCLSVSLHLEQLQVNKYSVWSLCLRFLTLWSSGSLKST